VSVKNIKPADANPFEAFSRLYCDTTNVYKETFLTDLVTGVKDGAPSFEFTLTILPHQIFIMPRPYIDRLKNDVELVAKGIRVYDNDDLR
jgi:hypothetical protein